MTIVMKDIVTWLKQWFYTEDEIDTITGGLQTQINNKADTTTVSALSTTVDGKANSSHTHGNLQNDGQVGSTVQASKNVVTDANGKITTENKYSHPSTHATTMIIEANALSNIGTSANANQHAINEALNTVIGSLQSINAIEVVDTKPTASVSTMGKLYIVSEDNKVNVYYTKKSGTSPNYTYAWQKMDADVLDELSISWDDVTGKPSSYTPSSHNHGNLQNDGQVGSTVQASKNVVTDANGKITTENKPTIPSANSTATNIKMDGTQSAGSLSTFAKADHVHPTDTSRASSDHVHGSITNDGKVGSSANIPLITGNGGVVSAGSFEGTATNIKMNGTQSVGSRNTFARGDHVHPSDTSKADKTAALGTTITLVDKGETNEGCIIFNTIS